MSAERVTFLDGDAAGRQGSRGEGKEAEERAWEERGEQGSKGESKGAEGSVREQMRGQRSRQERGGVGTKTVFHPNFLITCYSLTKLRSGTKISILFHIRSSENTYLLSYPTKL